MKITLMLFGIFCMILLAESVSADSPYGKMDVYYNGEILPGKEIAKPVLKIGEPFTVGINLTVYQKSEVSVELSEIGEGYFKIINGPTSKMNVYRADVMEENSTVLYEWTVAPTEKWAGGSMPIDIVYQINDFKTGKILVNSGFTIAYPSISTEYYEGETPTPEEPQASETESSPTSASTPAFKFVGAISILALAFVLFRR